LSDIQLFAWNDDHTVLVSMSSKGVVIDFSSVSGFALQAFATSK